MRGIIEWLLQAGVGQKVRADLYASLLYYLQLCQKPRSKRNDKGTRTSYHPILLKFNIKAITILLWLFKYKKISDQARDVTGLRISTQDIYSKLSRDNLKLFQTYGETLMMLICKDSSDGEFLHHIFFLFPNIKLEQNVTLPQASFYGKHILITLHSNEGVGGYFHCMDMVPCCRYFVLGDYCTIPFFVLSVMIHDDDNTMILYDDDDDIKWVHHHS